MTITLDSTRKIQQRRMTVMEESREIRNFIMVWTIVFASICYCHSISRLIPSSGSSKRLLAISPVISLFFLLPLAQTTISLGGLTAFFVAWLCNFKLILFAFNKGPLANSTPLPLHIFLAIACLPIRIKPQKEASEKHPDEKGLKSITNYVVKCLVIVGFLPFYQRKEKVPHVVMSLIYMVVVYVGLEVALAAVGAVARALIGVELEPQFHEPYLSTSLQDFWGRRWNLMVTNILRPTVYIPVRSLASRLMGRKWAALPAAFSSFFVSAAMHELIFYYIGRKPPNWAVSCFFLLHGVCLAVEIALKKAFAGNLQIPTMVSRILTVGFVLATALWIFLPALLRCDAEEKALNEATAVAWLVKEAWSRMRIAGSYIVKVDSV